MSRHARQRHRRERRAKALERQLASLRGYVLCSVRDQLEGCLLTGFAWQGVRKGVAYARVEAVRTDDVWHDVVVEGTVSI